MLKPNRGSAIIEVTMMVPIIFSCVYFYIMSMLFITRCGKIADELSTQLYTDQESRDYAAGVDEGVGGVRKKQGNIEMITYEDVFKKYNINFELKRSADDPVKNLRRWQFVADTIR